MASLHPLVVHFTIVLTIVGVRVFNFLPEDDFGPIAGSATLLD